MKIIIPQKQSGTGTIFDLESEHYERVIDMMTLYNYVVVLPSYYGSRAYRHTRAHLAIKNYNKRYNKNKLATLGARIVRRDGRVMDIDDVFDGQRLVETGNQYQVIYP